jgi:hypothetical protein
MLENTVKSAILRKIIHGAPGIMNKEAVKTLITDPVQSIFGIEDGADAIADVEMNEGKVLEGDKKVDELHLDIFPNVKLSAELEAAKNVNRMLYDDFTDAYLSLDGITKKLDEQFGDEISILLDEIKTIDGVNVSTVDKVKDLQVDLTSVNSENPNLDLQ